MPSLGVQVPKFQNKNYRVLLKEITSVAVGKFSFFWIHGPHQLCQIAEASYSTLFARLKLSRGDLTFQRRWVLQHIQTNTGSPTLSFDWESRTQFFASASSCWASDTTGPSSGLPLLPESFRPRQRNQQHPRPPPKRHPASLLTNMLLFLNP